MRTPPTFWDADDVNPTDRQSWKSFGTSGPGYEFLYLLSGNDGGLLYVGITWNPFVRWTAHSTKRTWWPLVTHATVWRCTDGTARYWETHCIKTMRPTKNIHQAVR